MDAVRSRRDAALRKSGVESPGPFRVSLPFLLGAPCRAEQHFSLARSAGVGLVREDGHIFRQESYTSKASFVDNDELRTYEEKKQKNAVEDGASPEAPPLDAVAYSGKRSASNRHWFIRRNTGSGRLSRVHADVNGALNIIRKVFSRFCYHAGLSLKFNVRRISPRLGAVTLLSLTG